MGGAILSASGGHDERTTATSFAQFGHPIIQMMASDSPSPVSGGTAHLLPRERARASFDVKALMKLVAGERPSLIEKYRPLFRGAPFDGEDDDYFRSYADLSASKLARVAAAVRITRENPAFMIDHIKQKVHMGDMFHSCHLGGIHFSMFLTFVMTQANDAQKKAWLGGARQAKYFGAYAQTELGHGSNVRALETTATFVRDADEFEIHSPTLTSLKWWPTGMYCCTHAVVFARLVDGGGVDRGFHGFMVQLRDDRGRMMPGVEVGEIGPKVNGKHANIGYARFTRVRVPRFNLFARYARVERDGTYVRPPRKLSKFKYISMMQIRMSLVMGAYRGVSQAATVAVRYSAVRRQGFKDTKAANPLARGVESENVVLDYTMQQYRTLVPVAFAYCLIWNARFVMDYLGRVQSAIGEGGAAADAAANELPELHATLAGLKVWSTVKAHGFIEECRKACGGQGFLLSSGVAELSRSFAEPVTVEGEQVILSLQVARFLIKAVRANRAGAPLAGSVVYLRDPALTAIPAAAAAGRGRGGGGGDADARCDALLLLLKDRARRVAVSLEARFAAAETSGLPFDQALNSVALVAYAAAEAHSLYAMARNNLLAVRKYVGDAATRAVLLRLFQLLALSLVRGDAAGFVGAGLGAGDLDAMGARTEQLLAALRPDAVALVDAFGWLDPQLQSAIGRADGNVYEAIYGEAKRCPLNTTAGGVMLGWEKLAPVLDLDFLRAGMKTQRVAPPGARL